jgi:hypothetical protein
VRRPAGLTHPAAAGVNLTAELGPTEEWLRANLANISAAINNTNTLAELGVIILSQYGDSTFNGQLVNAEPGSRDVTMVRAACGACVGCARDPATLLACTGAGMHMHMRVHVYLYCSTCVLAIHSAAPNNHQRPASPPCCTTLRTAPRRVAPRRAQGDVSPSFFSATFLLKILQSVLPPELVIPALEEIEYVFDLNSPPEPPSSSGGRLYELLCNSPPAVSIRPSYCGNTLSPCANTTVC